MPAPFRQRESFGILFRGEPMRRSRLLRELLRFFQPTKIATHRVQLRYHLSVLRVWTLVDTTPPTDEHLILYFSIDSSTVRTRLEGGSREVRDVDAGGWGDEGANVINYPSNDSDWWAAGQVQPGRNSIEVVTATNERRNGIIHITLANSNKDHSSKFD